MNVLTSEQKIKKAIETLNGLIKSGEYSEDIDDTLDTLFKEVSTLGIRQKQATLDKLERWTVKSQKYAQYRRSHSSFNVLENYIDFEKSCRELEITIYNYIYNLIVRHGGLVYYGKLINHYPDQDFINLHDRDCNSLFYNLCIKYLGRNDEYILNVIAYILEKSSSNFKSDIGKLRRIIEEKKKQGIGQAFKLDKLLASYYPNNSKTKLTSIDASHEKKSNHIHEHLRHGTEILPTNYRDREDLLSYMAFGLTNSSIVDNAFYVSKENRKTSIYHHISDIADFFYQDSKIEKDAEKQIFRMHHQDRTGSLFNPEFLKKYTSLNSGTEKLAITIKHNFDSNNRYVNSEIFKSAIYIGPVFSKEEANSYIQNRENPDLVKLYRLSTSLDSRTSLSPANKIIKEITALSSEVIKEKFIQTRTPAIFKHTLDLSDYHVMKEISDYTRKKLSVTTARDYISIFKEGTQQIGDYHVFPEEDSIINVDSPSRNFLDYKNLAILSRIIKHRKLSPGAIKRLREELEILAARANAIELSRINRKRHKI